MPSLCYAYLYANSKSISICPCLSRRMYPYLRNVSLRNVSWGMYPYGMSHTECLIKNVSWLRRMSQGISNYRMSQGISNYRRNVSWAGLVIG
nr:hypothetical protein Q903MT_gene965 [Picea sitchensis]